jgi:hypothetical protein
MNLINGVLYILGALLLFPSFCMITIVLCNQIVMYVHKQLYSLGK